MEARKIEGSNRVSAGSLHEMYGSASIGVSMGYSRETGKEVFQFNEDRFRHTLILGRTGSGKSNHIQLMERQDIRNGAGVAIIASHEEDAIYPLTWVPEWRMNDTVIIDASNKRYLPCLNPLDVNIYDENAVSKAIGNVIELLSTDCHYEWTGPRFKHMVRIGLELILDPGYPYARSIGELEKLFRDAEYAREALMRCTNETTKGQWQQHASVYRSSDSGDMMEWFLSKVSPFTTDEALKNMFGPGRVTIDFDDIVNNGKILVVAIPEARISKEASRLIASWVTARLKDAILNRGVLLEAEDVTSGDLGIFAQRTEKATQLLDPFFVYIDEFAKVATPEFGALLAESRKFRVGFVLSMQTLSQAKVQDMHSMRESTLLQAILGNVGTVVCYPMGAPDAQTMADFFDVDPHKTKRIERYMPLAMMCLDNDLVGPLELKVNEKPKPTWPWTPRRIARRHIGRRIWRPTIAELKRRKCQKSA